METDFYKTPEAEIVLKSTETKEFYVVSPKKFLILQLSTLGMYSIYWFYRHWNQYKTKHNEEMWPIVRGIFAIFFAHSLFTAFYVRAKDKYQDLQWSAEGMATLFVIVVIASAIISQFDSIWALLLGYTPIVVNTWILFKAQQVANLACEDAKGETNEEITALNIFWIILGLVWWLASIYSVYVLVTLYTSNY